MRGTGSLLIETIYSRCQPQQKEPTPYAAPMHTALIITHRSQGSQNQQCLRERQAPQQALSPSWTAETFTGPAEPLPLQPSPQPSQPCSPSRQACQPPRAPRPGQAPQGFQACQAPQAGQEAPLDLGLRRHVPRGLEGRGDPGLLCPPWGLSLQGSPSCPAENSTVQLALTPGPPLTVLAAPALPEPALSWQALAAAMGSSGLGAGWSALELHMHCEPHVSLEVQRYASFIGCPKQWASAQDWMDPAQGAWTVQSLWLVSHGVTTHY